LGIFLERGRKPMPVWKKKPILLYATYSEGHAEVI